jgi:hypothetical protein
MPRRAELPSPDGLDARENDGVRSERVVEDDPVSRTQPFS